MVRRHLLKKGIGLHDFRMRGGEITRIEGFSDAVFAFAVTLLVVSLEVPRTFSDLLDSMYGFVAFGLGFALLFLIWYNQYRFFRRYGLEDTFMIALTGVLLFVVLFFIYPLKFLFTFLVKSFAGAETRVRIADGTIVSPIRDGQMPQLMLFYSLGYVAIFTVFAFLYYHAYRQREALELNTLEQFDTRTTIQEQLLNICIGVASATIVLIGGERWSSWSGWIYVLLGPVLAIHGSIMGRRRRKFEPAHHSASST